MSEQKLKTKKGLKWSIIDQVVRQIITLLISAVLSRLLAPAEFGLLGMVTVAIGFLQVLKDIGLGSSIIQKQGITDEEKSTIFWVNLFSGILLALILVISAPFIADFFKESKLTLIIRVMSVNFIINSMAIVPDSLIMKSIDFKSFFFKNLVSVIGGGILAVFLALNNFGVWSLIGQNIFSSILGLAISLKMVQWRPIFSLNLGILRSHLKYSLPLLGDSSLNYWVRNIDNLMVGKFLGSSQLGIYNRAYTLMLLPVRQISSTLTRVMFPYFSIIQNDNNQIWNHYKEMSSVISVLTFPLMAFLGVYADEIILIMYGENWLQVVPIFKTLCILGAIQSIATLSGSIFYAKGKTVLMFKVGLVSKSIMISGIVLGMMLDGLMGMVWGYVFTSLTCFILEIFFVTKVLNKNLTEFFKSLLPEFISSLIFLFCIYISKYYFNNIGNFIPLKFLLIHLILFVISISIYFLILKGLKSKGIFSILKMIYAKK